MVVNKLEVLPKIDPAKSPLCRASLLDESLGTGPDWIDHGRIRNDLPQNGHYGGHFLQIVLIGYAFHPLEFFIERQLLVMMEILQPASEFQGRGEVLEQLGQLLNRHQSVSNCRWPSCFVKDPCK